MQRGSEHRNGQTSHVRIPAGEVVLEGDLSIPGTPDTPDTPDTPTTPNAPRGIVLFAHGSGSSRHSSRNQYVARVLQEAGIATLLFDLLTEPEESIDQHTGDLRFNIGFLAQRLLHATEWILQSPQMQQAELGYFGASTGAAAALVAAAQPGNHAAAVVSRGGRPDLAGPALSQVQAPTLLIVGGNDPQVLDLNRKALAQLPGEKKLEIVPGATHLFEESGTLEEAARLARQWFESHLGRHQQQTRAARIA
jgi:dienelactone hydrolase